MNLNNCSVEGALVKQAGDNPPNQNRPAPNKPTFLASRNADRPSGRFTDPGCFRNGNVEETIWNENPAAETLVGGLEEPSEGPGEESPTSQLEVAEQFAQLVRKPNTPVLLYDAEGGKAGWAKDVPDAIQKLDNKAKAFCVVCRDDLLIVDCDTAEASEYILKEFKSHLLNDGLSPVILASGRPGNIHLFVRVGDKDLYRNYLKTIRAYGHAHGINGKAMDLREGREQHLPIRPPFSPHRLGRQPQLLYPATIELALEYLTPPAEEYIEEDRPDPISPRISKLINNGDTDHRYKSRSEVLQAIVTEGVRTGKSVTYLYAFLSDPQNKGGAKLQETIGKSGEVEGYKYLAICRKNAVEYLERKKSEVTGIVFNIKRYMNSIAWKGKAGETDRAVMEYLLDCALEQTRITVSPGIRNIMDHAAIASQDTVRNSLNRLSETGFIDLIEKGSGTKASLYQLRTNNINTSDYANSNSININNTIDSKYSIDTSICEKLNQEPVHNKKEEDVYCDPIVDMPLDL